MSNMTLEPEIIAKLRVVTEPCWLRDAHGNVVGYYHPGRLENPRQFPPGEAPELTETEIERRLAEPGARSWDDIKHDLERLV